jgi:hypothetical protein
MTTKTPQDHLPAQGPLTFKTSQGELTLPHPSKLPSGVIRKARKVDEPVEQFFTIIESLFSDDSLELALCDKLELEELAGIFNEWLQGASLGESSGS